MTKSDAELRAIRDSVALIGRLSDSLLRIGPFSLGIDGILSWIPGLGDIYSVVAGGFIIVQGARAGVAPSVLTGAALLMGLRTAIGAVPLAGSAIADFFTAHKWAAAMVVRAIDTQLGTEISADVPPPRGPGFRGAIRPTAA
jgi:hypothetical protein